MRSGISHLSKRMEGEVRENAGGAVMIAELEQGLETVCELDEPMWSVVSFDKREAGGLTYRQAAELMGVLNKYGTNGLCVITDEAAKRYGS